MSILFSIPWHMGCESIQSGNDGIVSVQHVPVHDLVIQEVSNSDVAHTIGGHTDIPKIITEYAYGPLCTFYIVTLVTKLIENQILYSRLLYETIRRHVPYCIKQKRLLVRGHSPSPPYLLDWQHVVSCQMSHWMQQPSDVDPQCDPIRSTEGIFYTRTGYITLTQESSTCRRLLFPGCILVGRTGIGKSLPIVDTARRILQYPLPLDYITSERFCLDGIVVVVPVHTYQKWIHTFMDIWPDVRIRELKDMGSFKNLYRDLVIDRFNSFDVLMVLGNVFTTNHTTRQRLLGVTNTLNRDDSALETVEFRVAIIDEVHAYTGDFTTARTLVDGQTFVTRGIAMLRHFTRGIRTILISSTPNLDECSCIDQYIFLLGARTQYGDRLMTHPVRDGMSKNRQIVSFLEPSTTSSLRAFFLNECVFETDVKPTTTVQNTVVQFRSARLGPLSGGMLMRPNIPYLQVCQNRLRFELRRVRQCPWRIQQALDDIKDEECSLLGKFDSPDDTTINDIIVPDQMHPVGRATIRILVALTRSINHRVLVYSDIENLWHHISIILLQVHGITVVWFNGNLTSLNKKRKRFEGNGRRVMIIPKNRVDTTYFPWTTHIVVIGSTTNHIPHLQNNSHVQQLNVINVRPIYIHRPSIPNSIS